MWFNLSSFNLHLWITPSKASICLNFGLFFRYLFSVKLNHSCMYLVLHYRFPGLWIKPFLKKVHLIQRHSGGFCSLWYHRCCLYLFYRFCPATLCSTLIFTCSFLSCSRIFLLAILFLSVPVTIASPTLKMSWPCHGCHGFCCSLVASPSCHVFSKLPQQHFTTVFVYQMSGALVVSLGL